ncbi:MAG TPA: DoxX family protein [Bacteroidetes bacterium]|nr:DoxX family protein [Bacteroidota bacterium]
MNGLLGLGKYLFAIPFAVFGIMHLMSASEMAAMAPFGGEIIVYITGIAHIAAAVSILIGKWDKLATTLLGVMLLLFIIPHAQALSENPMEMGNILKNIALAGGAWMYALHVSKDKSVID